MKKYILALATILHSTFLSKVVLAMVPPPLGYLVYEQSFVEKIIDLSVVFYMSFFFNISGYYSRCFIVHSL